MESQFRDKARNIFSLRLDSRLKLIIATLVGAVFVVLNLRVFLSAYPVFSSGHQVGSNSTLDFGSYYTSAWRLIHNPAQIYHDGFVNGDPPTGATGSEFKYLPIFSFFILPLLPLGYVSALLAWNIFQFLLLPISAMLLWRAIKSVNVLVIVGVLWIVLLQPLPYPPQYNVSIFHLYHSTSYYLQWALGQAKVFMTFLIVATYYLSKRRRPYLAGLAYGIAFFDPRFPLYGLPLILMINRRQYRRFLTAVVGTLSVGNAILLYDGVAASFLGMVQSSGIGTGFFPFSWIPFYSIVALTFLEGATLVNEILGRRSRGRLPVASEARPPTMVTQSAG